MDRTQLNATNRPFLIRGAGLVILAVLGIGIAGFAQGCTKDDLANHPPILFNFYAVEEGRAYRSSQLSGEALGWVIDQYGIRTVVNLRGHNPGKEWYEQEVQACDAKGVTLVNIPMSSRSLPEPELLESIVQALEDSEYPILMHCESGSDRTGAASALYRLVVLGQNRQEAQAELSPQYWHFRNQKPCMGKIIEIYEPTDEWMERYRAEYQQIDCQ